MNNWCREFNVPIIEYSNIESIHSSIIDLTMYLEMM